MRKTNVVIKELNNLARDVYATRAQTSKLRMISMPPKYIKLKANHPEAGVFEILMINDHGEYRESSLSYIWAGKSEKIEIDGNTYTQNIRMLRWELEEDPPIVATDSPAYKYREAYLRVLKESYKKSDTINTLKEENAKLNDVINFMEKEVEELCIDKDCPKIRTFLGKPFKYWTDLRQENENYKAILNNEEELEEAPIHRSTDNRYNTIPTGKESLKEAIGECLEGIDQGLLRDQFGLRTINTDIMNIIDNYIDSPQEEEDSK